jgi:hypothetical protein
MLVCRCVQVQLLVCSWACAAASVQLLVCRCATPAGAPGAACHCAGAAPPAAGAAAAPSGPAVPATTPAATQSHPGAPTPTHIQTPPRRRRHEPNIDNTTNAAEVFPERRTTYLIDGHNVTGIFAGDLTLEELRGLRASQPWPFRDQQHNGRCALARAVRGGWWVDAWCWGRLVHRPQLQEARTLCLAASAAPANPCKVPTAAAPCCPLLPLQIPGGHLPGVPGHCTVCAQGGAQQQQLMHGADC